MTARKGEQFFFFVGLLLTVIVIAGFLPPIFNRPAGTGSLPLLYQAHGMVFLSWFVLFCLQARLVQAQNLTLHRALGKTSLALAGTMIILSYFMIRAAYANPEFGIGGNSPAGSVIYPVTDMVNFTIAFALAYINRTSGSAHKRLMLLAGILMLDPAVARLIETLGAPFPLIPVIELCLFGLLAGYDFLRFKKPHWATTLGLALFFIALAAKLTLPEQPNWLSFVALAFG